MKVDGARVWRELEELAAHSDTESPAITRVLFTPPDMAARAWFKGLCTAAGLTVREDAIGNVFARWIGSEADAPAIATGSHIDAIPHSGRFDGTVGVLGGLEAIRAMQAEGVRPRRSIELILFTSEEPTRFGIGCLGSRLLSGSLDVGRARELKDREGRRLEDVRRDAACAGELSSVRLGDEAYGAFVELHIEQGPLLEREGLDIGVVTAIAAPATLRMTLKGAGGHAGATLMPGRRDALCAAAEIVLAVEWTANSSGSEDAVATTGICRIHPGAVNSIPSEALLEIDVRDTKLAARDGMVESIRAAAMEVCHRRNVELNIEVLNADPPATCDAGVIAAIEAACGGLKAMKMVSRAYHDSLFMARVCPTGMIFIPCRGGISHRPDEWAEASAIEKGAAALAGTLAKLAG